TFPEIADSNWGVTEIVDDESGIGLEYLVLPLWFAETFLIDNQNAASFASQVESFEELSGIQDKVIELQDSIFTLERQTRTAYQTGYDNAFALYQNLNREHI